MLIATETTDTIEINLGGAVTTSELSCYVSYRNVKTTSGINKEFTPKRGVVYTNGATAVVLVPSPAADYQNIADYLSIFNNDTANQTIEIKINDGTDLYIVYKVTLGPNEKVEYQEGRGFTTINTSGANKTSINQGNNAVSSAFSAAILGADVTNNNAIANTIQDVTGLSFPVTNGKKYFFRFSIQYTAAATTTGSRWSVNGPTGTYRFRSSYTLTTTSETVNSGLTAVDTPAASSASSVTNGNIAIVEGFFEATADGSVIARFASEVASSAIVAKAGSVVYYQEVL